MKILVILLLPIIMALLSLLIRNNKLRAIITSLGSLLGLICSISLGYQYLFVYSPITLFNLIYVDALSLFFVFTISVVAAAAALYSQGYIEQELEKRLLTLKQAKYYYILFNLFVFSMLLVTVVNNLGLMWVAIELTTLLSAFLVGFHNTKNSVEAAWKYIIICSVGIILALLGTIFFSYAFLFATGFKSLNWTELMAQAAKLDPNLVKIAFIFILVGYGTKAGLAPMHTWLPDAHSQAISPISALLSGVLLKTAIYAILRYSLIVNLCVGSAFSSHLFILFGMLSLIVSAGFVLVQKDIKRLLAYSSLEHIGIIIFGFGVGGPLGIYGALLHIFNHAVTKSLLFFGAGNIVNEFASHNMRQMRGALKALPFTGFMVLIGLFALAGFPPFSVFFSEFMILMAAFTQNHFILGGALLLLIVIVFSALIYHFSRVLFGEKPKGMATANEPFVGKMAFGFLLVFILIVGWSAPFFLSGLIEAAADVWRGM
ncbi:hydrogenase 4 subunit F [Candidatus Saganbacteria bacterium]|nr:hydrogenase 4 subunit F [Candidatus Saganbacteria bacterium]